MMKETETLPCDVLVIGSGPGGSITACLLAEAGKDVLLLEEGPLLDVDFPPSFSPEEMRQKYRNGGMTIALGKTRVAYVEGRCVGGGSEINAGLYHRLPDDIQTQWQKSHRIADFDQILSRRTLNPVKKTCRFPTCRRKEVRLRKN